MQAAFSYRELEPRIAFDAALLASLTDGLEAPLLSSDGDGLSSTGYKDGLIDSSNRLNDQEVSQQVTAFDATDEMDSDTDISQFVTTERDRTSGSSEIVFVAPGVVDQDQLLATLGSDFSVFLLDEGEDGVAQMAAILAAETDVSAIHIISHGDQASLQLGTATLSLDTMGSDYAEALQTIGAALADDADIMVYGCNFGAGAAGQLAALQLAYLTGADVAASDDLTGSADQGGDWDLEVETGEIEASSAFSKKGLQSWDHILLSPSDIVQLPGVAANDIQAVYGFDVSTDLGQDDSASAQDLTLQGSPSQTTGPDGSGAIYLTGGDYAELPAFETGGALTVSAWVRFDSTASWQRVFDFGQDDAFGIGNIYVARNLTSNDLNFGVKKDGSYAYSVDATGVITNGSWLHFVATIDDDGTMSLYVNGSLAGSTSGATFEDGIRSNHYVGKSAYTWDGLFDGAIDNFVVLNKAVSASEAAALYTQTTGFSIEENASSLVAVGTVVGLDADAGDSLSYSLIDDANGRFAIDSVTGEITIADPSQLDYETATSHNITVRATDGSANVYDEVLTIALEDQSDEPQIGLPGAQSVDEDGPLTFSVATGNAITVSDDSGSDARMHVTLSASNGTLTLSQLTGITILAGSNASSSMVLEGVESALNAAFDGMVFLPDEDYAGAADVTITSALSSDLDGAYGFDAGDASDDGYGTAQDGTLVDNATTVVDGERGTVLSLDGDGDHVVISGVFNEPDHVTLSAWINLTAADTGGSHILSLGDNIAIAADLTFDGWGVSGVFFDGVDWVVLPTGEFLAGAGWHHLAYSFDDNNDTHTLYLDGQVVATATTTSSIVYANGADTYIGTHGNGATDFDFGGLIDDVRIYTRVLAAEEIATLASGKDVSTGSVAITVNGINDAPINSVPGPQTTSPDSPITFSSVNGNGISVADVDAGASLMEVSLTVANGTISLAGSTGLVFSLGDGTDDGTMTFQGTSADINTALDGLIFTPGSGFEGIASITLLTSDLGNSGSGGALSDSDVIEISVGIASFQQGTDGYVGAEDTFTTSDQPSTAQGALENVDVDDGSPAETGLLKFSDLFGSGTNQIPYGSVINDVNVWIYVLAHDHADQVTIHQMLVDWDESATHDSLNAGISLDDIEASSASLDVIDAGLTGWVKISGLQSLVQGWSDGGANYGFALVSSGADDWAFASSDHSSIDLRPYIAIDYTAPQAPLIAASGTPSTFTEGGSAVAIDPALTLSDADSSSLTGATIQITNYVNGEDDLSFVNQNGIVGSWDSGTGTLTLSGTASVADYQTALRSVLYSNGSDDPTSVTRSIDIVVSDAYVSSSAVTFSVNISAVNDIAYNSGSMPADQVVLEGSLSDLDLSTIILADRDDRGAAVTLYLSTSAAAGGQIYPTGGSGIAVSGYGTDLVALSGTISDLNSYLAASGAIRYLHPDGDLNGDDADLITVTIDDLGNTGSGSSSAILGTISIDISNVNDAPTGVPVVTGVAEEDRLLGVDVSGITDADGLGAFSYQWLRDGSAISGATASSYGLGDADVGHQISVRVSYLDGEGTSESLTSGQTSAIANVNDAPTGLPVLTGVAEEDRILGVDVSGITDADGLGAFSYQWLRDGSAISGASASSHSLGDADVGHQISVRVSYLDGEGTSESLTSGQTSAIANVNDAPSGLPVVTGVAEEDRVLGVDVSGITDADGLGAFSYQWLRDGSVISGAKASSYGLGDADVGHQISVRVSYLDGEGTSESVTSAQTAVIANVNDAPTGVPLVMGVAEEDQILGVDVSGIADADGLGDFSYQWLRDGSAISGATTSSHSLGDADVGHQISVRVSYLDGEGTSESLTSGQTSAIANVNDAPTGVPTILGGFMVGEIVRADLSALSDPDGLGAISYQWRLNGVDIDLAEDSQYKIAQSDQGGLLSVVISYVDAFGASEQLVTSSYAIPFVEAASDRDNQNEILVETDPVDDGVDVVPVEEVAVQVRLAADGSGLAGANKVQADATDDQGGKDREAASDANDGEQTGEDASQYEEERTVQATFKEFARQMSARVQYERLGFSRVDTQVVYQSVDRSLDEIHRQDQFLGASTVDLSLSVGSVLSAGFVTWVLRSGALMSALVSTMPVWRGFDPMIILSSAGPIAIAKSPDQSDQVEDDSNTERVFDHASKLTKRERQ